ncbi:MAG: hydroxyacylglutathione hydrolase [Pseudomonadota bacterium]
MPLEVLLVPCLEDNYNVLLHEDGRTVLIDAPDDPAIMAVLEDREWRLDDILITHNDWDHVDGLRDLKDRFGARVIGPEGDADAIGHIDHRVSGSDTVEVLGRTVSVLSTPGHTPGHISYHFADDKLAFVGDALFVMGVGRMRGQRAKEMWEGLERLRALPDDTAVYVGHEYTQANARFALSVDPGNAALLMRMEEVDRLRRDDRPTVPTTIGAEKATNPFLRADSEEMAHAMNMEGSEPWMVFGALRAAKDRF